METCISKPAPTLATRPEELAGIARSDQATDARTPAAPLRALALILLASAVVRVLLWGWFAGEPLYISDERDYNALANNLVEHGEFAFNPGTPVAIRPPLYPFFLAGVYSVFGLDSFQTVRLLQAGMGLLTAVLLYLLGSRVHSERVGLLLAALFSFYPSWLGQANMVLAEAQFTLLFIAACLAVVCFYQSGKLAHLIAAGVLLGLAALTRSVVWMSPPLLAVFVMATWRAPWGRRLAAVGLIVGAFAVTIAPWSIRNARVFGEFVPVDVMGGRNFMMGNYEHTPLYRSWAAISMDGEKAWHHQLRKLDDGAYGANQAQVDKAALRQGLKFMIANPGLTLRRSLVKFVDFWGLEREFVAGAAMGYWGDLPTPVILALAALIMGTYAVMLFAGIYGMTMLPLADRRLHWFLVLVVAYVCGIHTLVFAHSRYHLPVIPIVLLFSAVAIVNRRAIWERRKSWSFGFATALCLFIVGGWGWNFLAGDAAKFLEMVGMGT
jgi:4-amino-4-deoxy-L-arabinose transferase-like glycosyltransferase